MLLRIVSILFPLFAIVALGAFIGRRFRPDLSDANRLNMDVFVPALVFSAMASKDFHIAEYGRLLSATFFLIVASGVLGWWVARLTGIAPRTLVPPMMFNNAGNLGLPLAVLAFGNEALAPAVAMFVMSNLLHFSFGAWLLDHHTRLTNVWRAPSVLAALAGVVVGLAGVEVWPPLLMAIRMVGDISIPLMLLALGIRLSDARIGAIGFGLFGGVLRPVVGMALAWGLLQLFEFPARERALVLVFGALPPAVLNYMFAERYRQDPEKVASMVLLGNVVAVVFLPLALALTLNA